MKRLLTILLLFPVLLQGQTISKVICTEYRAGYQCSDGNIRSFNNGSTHVVSFPLPGGRTIVDAAGGFNSYLAVANDGTVWININDLTTNWTQSSPVANANLATDSSGATFNGVTNVDAMRDNYLAIKSDGSVWYFGADTLHLSHSTGAVMMRPIKISGALSFKKVVIGFFRIVGLTTTGDVYEWVRNSGSIVPVQKTIPRSAIDIWTSHYDYAGCLIPNPVGQGSQTMGYPYVWGTQFGAWRGNASYTQPTNITSQWGLSSTVPLQSVCSNWNTTHVIDSTGKMWGNAYCQTNGELGNGVEFANQFGYSQPYSWTTVDGENPSAAAMVQIGAGITWATMYSNVFFTFYMYARDVSGNYYSWGVDKAMVLGDGQLCLDEAAYRNNNDKTVPTPTTPLTATFKTTHFTLPTIGAGSNQTISTSSTTITATGHPALLINSANSTDSANYTPAIWLWTKTSGPACTITSPGSKSTTVTGLTTGTYTFNVLMTDNNGGTATGSMTVTATVTPPSGCNCATTNKHYVPK